MERPRAPLFFTFLVRLGLTGWLICTNTYTASGAREALHDSSGAAPSPVSRLMLTVETEDGKVHGYQPSSSIHAFSLAPSPAAEGWFGSFSRNLAVGVTVSAVLFVLSEIFSWMKDRHMRQTQKERMRYRLRKRKRLLRSIYRIEEELQALEDSAGINSDDPAKQGEGHRTYDVSRRAHKRDLQMMLEDLRYQLQDMQVYQGSSSDVLDMPHSAGETMSYGCASEYTHKRRHGSTDRLVPLAEITVNEGRHELQRRRRAGTAHETRKSISSSAGGSTVSPEKFAHQQQTHQHIKRKVSKSPGRRRGQQLIKVEGQQRMEAVRRMIDEVPGMPPHEVLRMAGNFVSRRS